MEKALTKMARISSKTSSPVPVVNKVKISNELIESFVRSSNIVAMKILFYIARAQVQMPTEHLVVIPIDTDGLCEFCNIDKKTLKRNLRQMTEMSISITNEKTESYMSIIPRVNFKVDSTIINVEIFRDVLELIWSVEKKFTVIDVVELMKLSSKHSVRMLQLLEMIANFDSKVAKRKHYALDELNSMFDTKYKRLIDFENAILKDVKEELDKMSKLTFTYTVEKELNPKGIGRPIAIGITINVIHNSYYQPSLM